MPAVLVSNPVETDGRNHMERVHQGIGRAHLIVWAATILVACGKSESRGNGYSGAAGAGAAFAAGGGPAGGSSGTPAGGSSNNSAGGSSGDASGGQSGDSTAGSSGGPAGGTGGRPDILDVAPSYFGFGYSSFSATRSWPPSVRESHGINWDFLYWYHLNTASDEVLPARLSEAQDQGVIPVLTHYQLLDRGTEAGYTGNEEWDVVIQAVQDAGVMRAYYDNVQVLMEDAADFGTYLIFQTEPDSTTWLRQYHTGGTSDANQGAVAVASSGHPDLSDLPDTIAGYAQALVRLRDRYAPDNVYLGLCLFDNENGWNAEDSVTFMGSLGTEFDVLFTHHVVKYETRDEGWWDAYSQEDQDRFVDWIETITTATGLRYIHWQTVIGAEDYGLMPDYPTVERISPLAEAGSIANLYDLYTLDGPPHSQPWHGYSSSPPEDHPAYNSLDRLAERLGAYYQAPISIPR